jgi:hypothetical protein
MQDGPESPSDAAVLHLVLLPTDKITLDWPAMIDAARPMAALSLMGALASAVAIYAARAAKPSRALTVTAVGLELALAYIVCRPAKGAPRKTASSGSGRSSRGRA